MHIFFFFFFDLIYILSLQHTVYIVKIITAVSFVGFFAGPVQRGDFGLNVYIFFVTLASSIK